MAGQSYVLFLTVLGGLSLIGPSPDAEPGEPVRKKSTPAVQRGRKALLEHSYSPPFVAVETWENLWKAWGLKEKPADFHQRALKRYGFHEAPYPNHGYPMGLRLSGQGKASGLSIDCMMCHGGSIFGKSYVGLGNSSFDFQTFLDDVALVEGKKPTTKYQACRVRGSIEAAAMTSYLLAFREPDLSLRQGKPPLDLDTCDVQCEQVSAWWHLKKKKTIYHAGGSDARSVRALMQFMMSPRNSAQTIKKAESTFVDVQAYLLSIQPPKYPLAINQKMAEQGKEIFSNTCSRCHGEYGEKWKYPNRIVPLKQIGTDPVRHGGWSSRFKKHYNKSWFAAKKKQVVTEGYQAPPLDGVWATAPYLHNGCAPTVWHVLNSKARPTYYTRSYDTSQKDYDPDRLGWKFQELRQGADPKLPPREQRKIYDSTLPGRGNQGHRYGDNLSEDERRAVIEYLKTL